MIKKVASLCCAVVLASASAAHADEIFSLTDVACSSGCSVTPAGTVTLHDNGGGQVLVTVQLDATDYSFRQAPDANHHALAFDLSGVTGVNATNISNSAFTFDTAPSSYKDAGLGSTDFEYAFEDGSSATISSFSFDLNGAGLNLASFVADGTDYFGVDVTGLTRAAGIGLTGNIGATGYRTTTAVTPEPSSLLMLGTGIFGAAGMFRRKLGAVASRG